MSSCHVGVAQVGKKKIRKVPTPCRKECNRAHKVSAGRTRCRDTSSPGEQRERESVRFSIYFTDISVKVASYLTTIIPGPIFDSEPTPKLSVQSAANMLHVTTCVSIRSATYITALLALQVLL